MKRIILISVLAMSQMGATDCGQVIKDPGFDLWCGDRLCDWKIEQGDAVRVSTWHEGDDGVELVGDDVLITQQAPVDSGDGTCIEFSMLTDVALDADVELEFDVFGDGTVDYTQSIPTAHWEPVSYLVSIAPPYNGIKFRLSKHGAGHAVLAEITAKTHKKEDCTGAPVALPPRPDGAWCVAQGDCASGVCDGIALPLNPSPVCSACVDDNGCSPGSVCGIDDAVPSWLVPYRACIPAASRALGELCKEDAECASGVCNQTCSTCNDMGHACAGGEACKPASQEFPAPNGYKYYSVPTFECAPGTHARATGETCLRSDDCASNSCVGTGETKTCIDVFGAGDGRACASDLDCPEGNTLTHGPCVAIGITGGTCQ